MPAPDRLGRRRGSSLTIVLLFLALLFSLWAAVHRTTASFLRSETARVRRDELDAGALDAIGLAALYLEKNPGMARVRASYGVTVQGTDFTVTFLPGADGVGWSVEAARGTYPVGLPTMPPK
ncbi:hypothetical protein OJF2_44090 [Aquisphaera giovannonii]|uniref:Uncharacterized protein n=2 Tax=Aquisphaera giovannonii TaxID=406548 RepID=A0A5B9W5D9_9BACT|nr:hypothetical protein OJF2_44090 [Aquisphaera giovannonii]